MTNELSNLDPSTLSSLITNGDCSKLSDTQRTAYYIHRCVQAGLDPATQPFQYLLLNGKLVLYAKKSATDGLAAVHGIVCEIVSQVFENDLRVVTVRSCDKSGRQTDEIGAVSVKGLTGENLGNALMKAVTKAKRRAILSLVGLGMLDETEVDSIPQSERKQFVTNQPQQPKAIEATLVAPAEPSPHERIMLVWNNGESGKAIVNTLKAKLYPGVKAGLTDEQKVPMADACDAAAAFAAWFTPESTLDVIARTAPESVTKVLREAVAVEEAKANEAATV